MGLLDNIKAKGQQLADSVKDKAKEKFDSSADIRGDISLIPKIAEEMQRNSKLMALQLIANDMETNTTFLSLMADF